jgi:cell division protein FtsQ
MARTPGPPFDDPFYRRQQAMDDALPLDAGLTEDDGEEEEQQYRRAERRVPVRRGALPRKAASRLRIGLKIALVVLLVGGTIFGSAYFLTHSWRFRVRNQSDIELTGPAPNSRAQVLQKMYESVGKNVFQLSLDERKRELEKIPWVETASVMRLWPNRLRVVVQERTPVAFAALGERVVLIDAQGVLMDMPAKSDYSFPVILGMNENEPLSTRAPRMRLYLRLMQELDAGGSQYSKNLDEVDLSDPDDVKVLARGGAAPVLLHLGSSDFLPRFMVFLANVEKWEQEKGKLESVDLRYPRIYVIPDSHAAVVGKATAATPANSDKATANAEPDEAAPAAAKPTKSHTNRKHLEKKHR